MTTTRPASRGFPGAVLAIRFLTELALLAGLAVAGARLGGNVFLNILSAVLWPALAAAIWGLVIAPKAKRRSPEPTRFFLEVALFAAAALGLIASGLLVAGIVLGVAGIAVAVAVRVWAKDG
ncbi:MULTISPECIES: YrdB family protein [unclassified Amycolatopsis]|uniref:YrdB family protein n=1 Tax=unclassified Amycolatopsis TaxID=2618356 RepID=UPI001EE7BD02|nr:YrdB family protein [Amycolatopsis sp. Poz14]MCG3753701.1 YrdB family protein [Amycolatopsis sp. Poz14]